MKVSIGKWKIKILFIFSKFNKNPKLQNIKQIISGFYFSNLFFWFWYTKFLNYTKFVLQFWKASENKLVASILLNRAAIGHIVCAKAKALRNDTGHKEWPQMKRSGWVGLAGSHQLLGQATFQWVVGWVLSLVLGRPQLKPLKWKRKMGKTPSSCCCCSSHSIPNCRLFADFSIGDLESNGAFPLGWIRSFYFEWTDFVKEI